MKKLLTIITLFVSSFFFLSLEDVKAVEIDFEVDLSLINDTFYQVKKLSDEFIESDTSYSDSYIIFYESNLYYVHFLPLNYNSNLYYAYYDGGTFYMVVGSGSPKKYKYDSSSNTLISSGSFSSNYIKPYIKTYFLFSNFTFNFRNDTSNILNYRYNDWSYSQEEISSNYFMSLYALNVEYEINSNPHQEELEKIESFYNVIIEKLSYIGEVLVSNYMYLSIIVIFLLILVFEMIFRRYL